MNLVSGAHNRLSAFRHLVCPACPLCRRGMREAWGDAWKGKLPQLPDQDTYLEIVEIILTTINIMLKQI